MKDLIKQYLDRGVSRRRFLTGLGALGITSSAASAMARSLAPFQSAEQGVTGDQATPSWMREVRGTGAALLVAQLKDAGIEYVFCSPSSGAAPFYDALVDDPDIHLIQGLFEGGLGAMADGYAKASGKTPFLLIAHPGLPSCMTQMFNAWKDEIPMIVATDHSSDGMDGFEDADNIEEISQPFTKWHWSAETAERIPEVTRLAFKFASTAPCGPVVMYYPGETLRDEGKALVMDKSKFTIPTKIRPDKSMVEETARLLVEAKNPLLYVGDEIVWCGAQKEVVELAELLGLPVTRPPGSLGWSKPFPTRNPLFLGDYSPRSRYPEGEPDVMLNLGSRMPYPRGAPRPRMTKLIQVRLDATNLGRGYPTDVPMVADLKSATTDLLDAIRSIAPAARLKQISEARASKTREYTAKMNEGYQTIARGRWDSSPITSERIGLELEQVLEKDACFIAEIDSGRRMEHLISFGGSDKQYFSNSGRALGWGLGASFGVKLAHPELQVVSIVGDGAFLFGGPQPLWSFARYRAPVLIMVMNNHSYNDERNRIWFTGGKQFQTGRDMACYLGDPDIDYAKIAAGFGVEGEVVVEPNSLRPAIERGIKAMAKGHPYLLDIHVEREGIGAASTWHPPFTIAGDRQGKV